MVYCIALILAAVVCIQARTFNNPILSDKQYSQPCAIKVNDTYYLVSQITDKSSGIFPIHTSKDLVHWQSAGYVFDNNNTPTWADKSTFRSPEIHHIGSQFVVYFSASRVSQKFSNVGAAVGSHPLGPYTSQDLPLASLPNQHIRFPSIINDAANGKLYLLWSNETSPIFARELHPNGLSFSSEQTITVVKQISEWAFDGMFSPFHIQRGQDHYIFYDSASRGVGMAHSTQALGPYQRLPSPILVSQDGYNNLVGVSVVRDLDNQNDVIFMQATLKDSTVVVLASLSWDKGKPIVGPL